MKTKALIVIFIGVIILAGTGIWLANGVSQPDLSEVYTARKIQGELESIRNEMPRPILMLDFDPVIFDPNNIEETKSKLAEKENKRKSYEDSVNAVRDSLQTLYENKLNEYSNVNKKSENMETLTKYFTLCRKLSENGIFNEIDYDKDAVVIGKQTYIKLDSYDGKWLLHCPNGDYYFKTVEEIIELLTSN